VKPGRGGCYPRGTAASTSVYLNFAAEQFPQTQG
jgi:hypothetical protein